MGEEGKCERDFGRMTATETWGMTPGGKRFLRVVLGGSASGFESGPDGESLEYLWSLARRASFILVDVSAMKYLNDLALGFDDRVRRELKPTGGDGVLVVAPNSKLDVIFKMLGLEFELDEAAAIARLDRGRAE